MTKRTLISIFGCILILFYLLVAVGWSRFSASAERCVGLENGRVEVIDPDNIGFITSKEITAELLGWLPDSISGISWAQFDLNELQDRLRALDKIENAEVVRLSDDCLRVRVWPMKPVARIWPSHGRSYYVNRDGKRILASAKYHVDVPQVVGDFDSIRPETSILPLLDDLAQDPEMEQMVSMIDASDSINVMLVPAVRGHLVNLGRPADVRVKLSRLKTFYKKVMPVKGWEFYDTLSLKWNGQIVATRRNAKMPDLTVKIIDELEHEGDDLATMAVTQDITLNPDTINKPQ